MRSLCRNMLCPVGRVKHATTPQLNLIQRLDLNRRLPASSACVPQQHAPSLATLIGFRVLHPLQNEIYALKSEASVCHCTQETCRSEIYMAPINRSRYANAYVCARAPKQRSFSVSLSRDAELSHVCRSRKRLHPKWFAMCHCRAHKQCSPSWHQFSGSQTNQCVCPIAD